MSLFSVSAGRDRLIKTAVTIIAGSLTGTKISIRGLSLGLLSQSVKISGFRIYNPKGFPAGIFVDIPKIYADFNIWSLLKEGKLHIRNLDLHLKKMTIIKREDNRMNVDALTVVSEEEQAGASKKVKQKSSAQMPMQIDFMKLELGELIYKDYGTEGSEPSVRVFNLNLKKEYKNITSTQQLTVLIMSEPMKAAGIKGAAIYGVTALAGTAILPVTVAAAVIGKDSTEAQINKDFTGLFKVSLQVLKKVGKVKQENASLGVIKADVEGAQVSLELKEISKGVTGITVSARKLLLPRPEIAEGVIYQIREELK